METGDGEGLAASLSLVVYDAIPDILAMKLNAVMGRAKLRDYFDLMVIDQQTGYPIELGIIFHIIKVAKCSYERCYGLVGDCSFVLSFGLGQLKLINLICEMFLGFVLFRLAIPPHPPAEFD